MNIQINQLVKSLLQKNSLDECSLQELQSFADSNPHFGAAQLLLTKKIKAENPDLYNEQLQKTFLYFHNPLWVEQLMNDTGNATVIAAPPVTQTIPAPQPTSSQVADIEEKKVGEVEIEIPQPIATVNMPQIEELVVIEEKTIIPQAETTIIPAAAQTIEAAIPEPSIAEQTIALAELKIKDAEPIKEELAFEPFHTVDYFASQGIKAKLDDKPTDKFGQQLKSFTDWLKILRKSPVSTLNQNITTSTEKKVEQMAEHSLQGKEIITEAMAEVWAKQGNIQKAINLYTKLSLQEPDKSVYFAALIDDLKKKL